MLDALGNIGDFLRGIGVVITLLYLAAQIRQNTTFRHFVNEQKPGAELPEVIVGQGPPST